MLSNHEGTYETMGYHYDVVSQELVLDGCHLDYRTRFVETMGGTVSQTTVNLSTPFVFTVIGQEFSYRTWDMHVQAELSTLGFQKTGNFLAYPSLGEDALFYKSSAKNIHNGDVIRLAFSSSAIKQPPAWVREGREPRDDELMRNIVKDKATKQAKFWLGPDPDVEESRRVFDAAIAWCQENPEG